jgi:hypothetical protein
VPDGLLKENPLLLLIVGGASATDTAPPDALEALLAPPKMPEPLEAPLKKPVEIVAGTEGAVVMDWEMNVNSVFAFDSSRVEAALTATGAAVVGVATDVTAERAVAFLASCAKGAVLTGVTRGALFTSGIVDDICLTWVDGWLCIETGSGAAEGLGELAAILAPISTNPTPVFAGPLPRLGPAKENAAFPVDGGAGDGIAGCKGAETDGRDAKAGPRPLAACGTCADTAGVGVRPASAPCSGEVLAGEMSS